MVTGKIDVTDQNVGIQLRLSSQEKKKEPKHKEQEWNFGFTALRGEIVS